MNSKWIIAIIAIIVYLSWRNHAFALGSSATLTGPGNSNINSAGASCNCYMPMSAGNLRTNTGAM